MKLNPTLRLTVLVGWTVVSSFSWAVDLGRTLIGVHGGMNVARLDGTSGVTSRNGVLAGGNLELPVGDFWFVQIEGYYVQKGASFDSASIQTLGASSAVTQYDLLEMSVLAKAKFGVPAMMVEVAAGPSFGIALTRQTQVTSTGGSVSTTDQASTMSGTDFGLQFGAGVEFAATDENTVFMNLRYAMGLSSITASGVTTKGFFFLGGLRFRI